MKHMVYPLIVLKHWVGLDSFNILELTVDKSIPHLWIQSFNSCVDPIIGLCMGGNLKSAVPNVTCKRTSKTV